MIFPPENNLWVLLVLLQGMNSLGSFIGKIDNYVCGPFRHLIAGTVTKKSFCTAMCFFNLRVILACRDFLFWISGIFSRLTAKP